MAAFADHAFADGMQGRELDMVVFSWRFFLQVAQGFFERDEFTDEDVGLVDFICDYDEALLSGEFEYGFDVLGR